MRKFVLLAAVALGFAPAPLPKRARTDDPLLHGEWEVVSWTKRVSDNEGAFYFSERVKIAPGRFETHTRGELGVRWSLTLAPSGRPPRMDLLDRESGGLMLGIYDLRGETLTICYGRPGQQRPDAFHSNQQWMLVLKRKRP